MKTRRLKVTDQEETYDWEDIKKELEAEGIKSTPGSRLKSYRSSQLISRKKLANRSGICKEQIAAMEKGLMTIYIRAAKKLAKVLGVNYRKLL